MNEFDAVFKPERPQEAVASPADAEHPDRELSCICNSACGIWYLEDREGHLVTMWRPGGWFWAAAGGVATSTTPL